MSTEIVLSGVLALAFALIHVVGGQLSFLRVTPRSVWLSAERGVSVDYVFVHLLPELAEHQERVSGAFAPEDRESRFSAFAIGTAAYAALRLVTE